MTIRAPAGSPEASLEAAELIKELSTETFYGMNLSMILSESTPEEREVVFRVIRRAKRVRERIAELPKRSQTESNNG